MRVSRFLSTVSFITIFCLLYVYQQTEIVRLAYAGQKQMAVLDELAEKNSVLRYTIERNASLVHIGDKISLGSDLQMPDSYRLVKFALPRDTNRQLAARPAASENIFSRFFSVKTEAQAKTISSSTLTTHSQRR